MLNAGNALATFGSGFCNVNSPLLKVFTDTMSWKFCWRMIDYLR